MRAHLDGLHFAWVVGAGVVLLTVVSGVVVGRLVKRWYE